ncbi:MAG: B12-binding domain-containing radical SAM protein [Desulfuromonadaceae bacterium]
MTTKSRICLIYPSDGLCYKFQRARTKRMPLGLAYIAASLIQAGHEVSVVDGALHDLSTEETVDRALAADPHFIGVSCTTPIYHRAVEIIALAKQRKPDVTVIIGGPHVSALPEATLDTCKADFVCIGEGEESARDIVEHVLLGKDPSNIPSIAYNWNGKRGHNRHYRLRLGQKKADTFQSMELDSIPYPARSVFEWEKYMDFGRDVVEPQTTAMFSRGCIGKCSFCGAADTLIRWRSVENVLGELELIQSMGIKNIFLTDDSYTVNRNRVLALSKGIVERGIHLNMGVQLRLDQLDEEICDAMYASGIRYVGPGIESGNEEIIKQIGKGPKESKKAMRSKIRLLQKYDWKIRNSYVMGMPGETETQIMDTIEFAKELGADENAFSIVVPYPDSPLWQIALARGLVHDKMDFSKFLYYHEIGCNLSAVSTEKLLELHEFAYEYVGNPSYRLGDDAVSSGNRPHIPYLASEAFREFRQKLKTTEPSMQ